MIDIKTAIDTAMSGSPHDWEGHAIASIVASVFPEGFKGVCIDVGAYHPTWLSNSNDLEQSGWSVYCIEANPYCIPLLREQRRNVLQYGAWKENCTREFYIYRAGYGPNQMAGHTGFYPEKTAVPEITEVIQVEARTLEWILSNKTTVGNIDFLSVDVEGAEMDVLAGLDLQRRSPCVIAIENVEGDNHEIQDYLTSLSYSHRARIVFNDIYVRRNLL